MTTQRTTNRTNLVRKPDGGYKCISVMQLCMIWRAYKSRLLPKFYDLRVYFALHELTERRTVYDRTTKTGSRPQEPYFTRAAVVSELRSIVDGLNDRLVGASLRRLERLGLAKLTENNIAFARRPEELHCDDLPGIDDMWHEIDVRERVRQRWLPIPRRMIRFMASESVSTETATLLAHSIRCLWLRGNRVSVDGFCSARFVAEVFDVHVRTVKRSRSRLMSREARWLIPIATTHSVTNRFGQRVMLNPRWSPTKLPDVGEREPRERSGSPPRIHRNRTESPPPIGTKKLPSGSKNQEPARRRSLGVCGDDRKNPNDTFSRLTVDDLSEPARLELLFAKAVTAGRLPGADADRLRFFAAAQHALRIGNRNPCGLFVWLIRNHRWEHVTASDEDRARRMVVGLSQAQPCDANHASGTSTEPGLGILVSDLVSGVAVPRAAEQAAHIALSDEELTIQHAREFVVAME